MNIKQKLAQVMIDLGSRNSGAKKLHSDQFGDFNLADPRDRKRLKKVVIDLQRETDRLSEHDLSNWRMACQMARNVEHPNRCRLYDVYADVELDGHVTGTIGQVNDYVKARAFKLVKENGETDEDAVKLFDRVWFKDLLDYALEATYWGHSLIELGDVSTDINGRMTYDGVKLIPRKHVVPEKGVVTREPGDDWTNGIPFRESPYTEWLIEVGKPDRLGLFEKAALHTISKKYAGVFWDTFAEMFGIPIRIATTAARDDKARKNIASMMENMGAKAWGVFDDSTDIKLVESNKSDSYNVYDKRIERANSELSKIILHQTMTIDDGSSLSQSQTHQDVLKHLIEAHCDSLRDVINNQLLPRMEKHGFPVKGLSFEWDDTVSYTPEQQIAAERLVVENYEVDGSYFEDKYGIPAGERRSISLVPTEQPKGENKPQNNAFGGFFD